MHKLMIITDLDGSLLDTNSYGFSEAKNWLDYFRARNIPVVFCTSKTQAEVLSLQNKMHLENMPYICENGSVLSVDKQIHLPSTCLVSKDYQQITGLLSTLRVQHQFKFSGFNDATVAQIMQWTGLSSEWAAFAKQRQASEPIKWLDSELNLQKFEHYLALEDLILIRGGRFWHVMNLGSDKSLALELLREHYRKQQKKLVCIGLGDSPNDLLFLKDTEYSVVIRSNNSELMKFASNKQVYFTQATATQGWVEGLDYVMPQLNNTFME